jgi:hypothetical protein
VADDGGAVVKRPDALFTGRAPHADVVLPSLTILEAQRLSQLFARHEDRNPYKQRR